MGGETGVAEEPKEVKKLSMRNLVEEFATLVKRFPDRFHFKKSQVLHYESREYNLRFSGKYQGSVVLLYPPGKDDFSGFEIHLKNPQSDDGIKPTDNNWDFLRFYADALPESLAMNLNEVYEIQVKEKERRRGGGVVAYIAQDRTPHLVPEVAEKFGFKSYAEILDTGCRIFDECLNYFRPQLPASISRP